MTITTKQIRAALDAALEPHGHIHYWKNLNPEACKHLIKEAPEWCRWLMEQIEARDALLRRFVDHYAGGHDDYCSGCHRNCAEARKILEESK